MTNFIKVSRSNIAGPVPIYDSMATSELPAKSTLYDNDSLGIDIPEDPE